MAGLVDTGGAVRGLTLAAFNLPKEVFVATSAAIDMGIDVARTLVYAGNGYLHLHDLALAPLLALVAMAGTWIGAPTADGLKLAAVLLRAPISNVFCQLVDGMKLLNEIVVRLAIELASGASLAAKSSRG